MSREFDARNDGRFRGRNFMTPHVLGYATLTAGLRAEISTGRGIDCERIYGVTVRDREGREPGSAGGYRGRFSRMVMSLEDAWRYIAHLRSGRSPLEWKGV